MAGSKASSVPARTPSAKTPSASQKVGSALSTGKQQSILGFFAKAASTPPTAAGTPKPKTSTCLKDLTNKSNSLANKRGPITPVPSSDAIEPPSSQENLPISFKVVDQPLPSPVTPAERVVKQVSAPNKRAPIVPSSSPTRKVCFAGPMGPDRLLTLHRLGRRSTTPNPTTRTMRTRSRD
jgi:DNA mismatch repair protein MSH6